MKAEQIKEKQLRKTGHSTIHNCIGRGQYCTGCSGDPAPTRHERGKGCVRNLSCAIHQTAATPRQQRPQTRCVAKDLLRLRKNQAIQDLGKARFARRRLASWNLKSSTRPFQHTNNACVFVAITQTILYTELNSSPNVETPDKAKTT